MTQAMLRRMNNHDGDMETNRENMDGWCKYLQMNANMERCLQTPHGNRCEL